MEKLLILEFLIFLSFQGSFIIAIGTEMKYPLTLSNIEELYTSSNEIPAQTPIVDYGKQYIILEDSKLTKNRIEDSIFGLYEDSKELFSNYRYNYRVKPLNYHKHDYFFSDNCNLYIFNYYENPPVYWNNYLLKINLDELGIGYRCDLNLEMSDYSDDSSFAVYNVKNNLISVFKVFKINEKKAETFCKVSMNNNIVQALIYCYYKESFFGSGYYLDYTLLIGIDKSGLIQFWKSGYFSNCGLEKSEKFEPFIHQIEGRIADLVDFGNFKKKLLFINNNKLILIDLNDLKIKINQEVNFYGTSLLIFKDLKQGLIGTNSGKIYLITVNEKYISIDDNYDICPGKKVKSLSYNKNAPSDIEETFVIVANCGYYKVFHIKNRKINTKENNNEKKIEDSDILYVVIFIIFIIFICYLCFPKKRVKK